MPANLMFRAGRERLVGDFCAAGLAPRLRWATAVPRGRMKKLSTADRSAIRAHSDGTATSAANSELAFVDSRFLDSSDLLFGLDPVA